MARIVVALLATRLLSGCCGWFDWLAWCDDADGPGLDAAPDRDEDGDGYAASIDCDDGDPLLHPADASAPTIVADRCGEGQLVAALDTSSGWEVFATAGSTVTIATEPGCAGEGVRFDSARRIRTARG